MEYRREIDGLRSIAVIPVILFHAGFESFSGGFVGVDVFFVISGFLITTIILSEKIQGKFSIVNFYERRARRILPALFFVMLACLPIAWFSLLPRDLKDFSQSLAAVSLFSSNFLFWLESGYFATASELKPLLHTWSLAVEEQYYVFFPLYLMLVWKYRKRWVFGSIIILGLFSIVIAEYWSIYKPDAAFFLLPTRAWELMIGAAAAFFLLYGQSHEKIINENKYTSETLGLLGLASILFSVVVYNKNIPFPSIYALLPTLGTVLILLFSSSKTFVGKILGKKLFVGVGLVSYSAYLWHQPLFVFSRHINGGDPVVWVYISLIMVTFFLAFVSWQFIEKPFRNKSKFGRKSIFVYSMLMTLFFLVIGVLGHITSGYEKQFFSYRLSTEQKINYQLIKESTEYSFLNTTFDDQNCKFWNKNIDQNVIQRYLNCFEKYGEGVIILGDSHAINMFNIVAKSDYRPFVMGISQGGCRPQDNESTCHYDDFDDFVSKYFEKIDYILFHQSGSYFVKDSNGNFDSPLAFKDNQAYELSHEPINKLLTYLERLNEFVTTVWIGPFVEARVELNLKRVFHGDLRMNLNSIKIFRELEPFIISQIKKSNSFALKQYLSLNNNILIDENFLKVSECITFYDIDHYSRCGEDLLAIEMKPLLDELDKTLQRK